MPKDYRADVFEMALNVSIDSIVRVNYVAALDYTCLRHVNGVRKKNYRLAW